MVLTVLPTLLKLISKSRLLYLGVRELYVTAVYSSPRHSYPKLTPRQVSAILRQNDMSVEIDGDCSVKCFECNQLASNQPNEDRRSEARCLKTPGMLFGVFDGHGGGACAQAVGERFFDYIAVSLLPFNVLEDLVSALRTRDPEPVELLEWYRHENDYYNVELSDLYKNSLERYMDDLKASRGMDDDFDMTFAIQSAASRLDSDIGFEALPTNGTGNVEGLEIAFSGCTACVAHVDGPHLHVANCGDSRAVLGSMDENNQWTAKPLSNDHTSDNPDEVKRIKSEHPSSEISTVIRNERLLGELVPLRAFGDYRYKWPADTLKSFVKDPKQSHLIVPHNYFTPPYLAATPEVIYHRLTPRDKFLIIATDGLWEQLSSEKVVTLVGEHMSGRQTLDAFYPNDEELTLGQIDSQLKERLYGLENQAKDHNVASHLIRNSLSLSEHGVDHAKLSTMLSLPREVVRNFRDDMTVTVIYFNIDYLAQCPV